MKEYDYVELIVDKDKYIKKGVRKGMRGVILDPRCINGHWHICFEGEIFQNDSGVYCTTEILLSVDESDLKVIG